MRLILVMAAFLVCGFVLGASLSLFWSPRLRASDAVTRGPGDGLSLHEGLLHRGGVPFTGTVIDTFPGGTVRARTAYAEGGKHGASREYYASGAIRWKRSFARGVKEGRHAGWWENGNRMFAYRFHNGEYRGDAREWYEDGSPAREMHYAHGAESGMQRAWRLNGTLYANYEARDGRQYGIVNSRLCYSVKDGAGVYRAPE